jgi:hypothetical protein
MAEGGDLVAMRPQAVATGEERLEEMALVRNAQDPVRALPPRS